MAVKTNRVTVGTSATRLDVATEADYRAGQSLAIRNVGASSIYIGDAAVLTSTGFLVGAGETFFADVFNEPVYGIAAGSVDVHVFQAGV